MLKPHLKICLAAFLVDFAVMIGITALPFYLYNQVGGGAALSGGVGAVQAASYAAACLASAAFVSRAKNAIHWAMAGVSLFALFSCLVPATRNPWLCGAWATLAMASMALVWPALHSWVGAEPDVNLRARRMGWFNISWSSGFAISPLLAGPLYDYHYWLPFVFLSGVAGLCVAALWTLPNEKAHFGAVSQEVIDARAGHDRSSEVHLYCAWFATLMGSAVATVTRMVFPKRVDELVSSHQLRILFESTPADFLTHGAATKYSWLAFVLGLTAAITFLAMGNTRRWQHTFSFLFWLQVASGIAFWVLGATRSLVVMALCFIVIGAFSGGAFFASVFYSMANPERKHRRAAINEGVVGMGGLVGSLVFGYLAGCYGMAFPFHYTPVFIALGLIVQAALLHHGRVRMARVD